MGVGVILSTFDSIKLVGARTLHIYNYLMTRMSDNPVIQSTKERVGDGLTVRWIDCNTMCRIKTTSVIDYYTSRQK